MVNAINFAGELESVYFDRSCQNGGFNILNTPNANWIQNYVNGEYCRNGRGWHPCVEPDKKEFNEQTNLHDLNTKLVRYSDPHCILVDFSESQPSQNSLLKHRATPWAGTQSSS